MGKALLIMVLGAGLVLAKQLYSNQVTERESRLDQVDYQEEVLAREIARSAFNTAMGMAREYPNALDAAVTSIHGADGAADTMYAGTTRGGQFRVRAEAETGHTLRITATGYFGGEFRDGEYMKRTPDGRWVPAAVYTMSDSYRIRVLEVREDGELDVSFLESMAGWCSAVFVQEFRENQLLSTRMVFAAGRNRNGATPGSRFYVRAGTQLNFFIGVDQNCSLQPTTTSTCGLRSHMTGYTFNTAHYREDGTRVSSGTGDWDHLHHALDVPVDALERAQEATWGLVEQHPSDRQRWRIGWEDQHLWDRPTSNTPRNSIQATKRQGYDADGDGRGDGWAERNAAGYRDLDDFGSYPDFSDQVIEIAIRPLRTQQERDDLYRAMLAERAACSITSTDGMPPEPQHTVCHAGATTTVGERYLATHLGHGDTAGTCPVAPTPEPEPEPEPPPPPPPPPTTAYTCPCSSSALRNGKIGILHRPPGNESNGQTICISENGWRSGHRNRHNDVILCRGD